MDFHFPLSYSVFCETEYCCFQEPVNLPLGSWLSLETDCDLNMFPNEQEISGDRTEFVGHKERKATSPVL